MKTKALPLEKHLLDMAAQALGNMDALKDIEWRVRSGPKVKFSIPLINTTLTITIEEEYTG